jgi:hypothetical protein
MTLLISVIKQHICNVAFINIISKVITSEVFYKYCCSLVKYFTKFGQIIFWTSLTAPHFFNNQRSLIKIEKSNENPIFHQLFF